MKLQTLACGSLVLGAIGTAMAGGGSYAAPASAGGKGAVYGGGKSGTPGAVTSTDSAAPGSGLVDAIKPLWDLATIYEGDGFIKEVGFNGRYQGQYYWADSDDYSDDDYETRRARLGFGFETNNGLEFNATYNIELDDEVDIDSLDSAHLTYETDAFYVSIGKLKPKITAEYSTSSKRILTFERSLLVNQVTPDKTGAIAIGGETNGVSWDLYYLTGGVEGEHEYPTADGGDGFLARLGFDLNDATSAHVHYLYQDADEDSANFSDYESVVSVGVNHELSNGGIIGDLIYATGDEGTSDVWGIVVMPHFDLSENLKLVLRYQYATSDSDDGIRLQKRYERTVAGGNERGDTYHAIYAGLNYYLMGDKLKLMGGIEYSDLSGANEYDGWTALTGLRLYF